MNTYTGSEFVPTMAVRLPFMGERFKGVQVPIGLRRTSKGLQIKRGFVLLAGRRISTDDFLVQILCLHTRTGKWSSKTDHYLQLQWRETHPEQYVGA